MIHWVMRADLCEECILLSQSSTAILGAKTGKFERRTLTAHEVCVTCTGIAPSEPVECESLDCSWLYARKRAEHKLEVIDTIAILVEELDSGRLRMPEISSEDVSDSTLAEV